MFRATLALAANFNLYSPDTKGVLLIILTSTLTFEDRGGTVAKVLCYKSEGRWFDPSWCQWIFH